MNFHFVGEIPASKSILNRALIAQSYFPDLELLGDSNCDDVVYMKSGLKELSSGNIYCGEGGTTFRFLCLRASRLTGSFLLRGTSRLLERPQAELLGILSQLGVQAELSSEGLKIESKGWERPALPLRIDSSSSSQFISSLVLNAWGLDFDLSFEASGPITSESYFHLTLDLLKELGMEIHQAGVSFLIPKGQKIRKKSYRVESDLSSAFTIAASGALAGHSQIKHFPKESSQPDLRFIEIFKDMGVDCSFIDDCLNVTNAKSLRATHQDLSKCPDLFPVLAVMCSYAEGESVLFNAPQLVDKESNRIQKTSDLFKITGVAHELRADGIVIQGNPRQKPHGGVFDPDQDHRMVMAAGIMKLMGHSLKISNPEVISKSYPELLTILELL